MRVFKQIHGKTKTSERKAYVASAFSHATIVTVYLCVHAALEYI